jgi:hypothetical protein
MVNRNYLLTSKKFITMAKYGKKAQEKVEKTMHEYKRGTLKSGKAGKGGKVKSKEQAIAIGLSQARKAGAKVPPPPKGKAK